jgi:ubiquinone/menaquinone biosynthesis C-methylase UbiE
MSQTTESLHQTFQSDDASVNVEAIVRWLDRVDAHPLAREVKRRMGEVRPVAPGSHVLDMGCGLGHEVTRLASRVGPSGRVVGVDASPQMIAEARRRTADVALPTEFTVGDAHDLPFPDGTFDLCRTERVLRYLHSPETALREMARVARPGGSVLAQDFDSDLTVVDAADPSLARHIAEVLDAAVPNPWIGRQLFGLFRRVGLIDVRVVAHTVVLTGASGFAMYQQLNQGTINRAVQNGHLSAHEEAAWWADLELTARAGTFCAVNLGFIVTGGRP